MSTSKTIFNKEFKQKIKSTLSGINSSIPKINEGGCAYFALILYPYLKEKTDDVEIILLSHFEDKSYYAGNKKYFDETKEYNQLKFLCDGSFPLTHIMLKCENYYIDASMINKGLPRFFKAEKNIHKMGSVPYDVLEYWWNNGDWNKNFNQKKYKDIMKKGIDLYLKENPSIIDKLKFRLEVNK